MDRLASLANGQFERESEEAREGIAAFNEKRKPKWVV